jgi:16S rRNA (guanine966-N2)-methyltransferase
VLDLFAGSGALGLEALSRGAASCLFVDSDRRAVQVVQGNLDRLGLADRGRVTQADAVHVLRTQEHFDLALLDPPYQFQGWDDLLTSVPADFVVIESDRIVELPDPWETVRTRTYGSTVVVFARNVRGPAPE